VVSTGKSTVICSNEYEQSDCESTRRSFQSVRSYELTKWSVGRRGHEDIYPLSCSLT